MLLFLVIQLHAETGSHRLNNCGLSKKVIDVSHLDVVLCPSLEIHPLVSVPVQALQS